MPVDFEIDHGAKRVIARASGPVALSDILTYLDAITVQGAAAYPKLFDAREAHFELSDDDMMILAARSSVYATFRPGPTAFVVDMARESTVFVRRYQNLAKAGREVELFNSLEAAQEWLGYAVRPDN
mgnify:CR=1 FL=1|jgi:hypothetical protein